ncbi:MAG: VanZ family protein [Armatimonadota bacterium]
MRWLAVLAYMAGIFVLSAQPTLPQFHGILGWDKLHHMLAFGGLAALAFWAGRRYRLAFAVAALYGVVDELHQSFVPGRTCGLDDLVADLLGAALVLAAIYFIRRGDRDG